MTPKRPTDARQVVLIILILVALINLGYGAYLFLRDGSAPLTLLVSALSCGALAVAIGIARARS